MRGVLRVWLFIRGWGAVAFIEDDDARAMSRFELKDGGGKFEVKIAFFDAESDVGLLRTQVENEGFRKTKDAVFGLVFLKIGGFVAVFDVTVCGFDFDEEDVTLRPRLIDMFASSVGDGVGHAVSVVCFTPGDVRFVERIGGEHVEGIRSRDDAMEIRCGEKKGEDAGDIFWRRETGDVEILRGIHERESRAVRDERRDGLVKGGNRDAHFHGGKVGEDQVLSDDAFVVDLIDVVDFGDDAHGIGGVLGSVLEFFDDLVAGDLRLWITCGTSKKV